MRILKTGRLRILPKISKQVIFFLAGSIWVHALEIPTQQFLEKHFKHLHTDSLGTQLFMPNGDERDRLQISKNDTVVEIKYTSPKSFSDKRFTKLADRHGGGGLWHEAPMPSDKKIHRYYPGLEQQWFLQGYQDKKGWMGSGLHNNQFFLVFRSSSPVKKTEIDGPLQIKPGFVSQLRINGSWIPTTCPLGQDSSVCYVHELDHELKISWDGKDSSRFMLWTSASNDVREIQAAMESLKNEDIPTYSKELPALAKAEGQSIFYRIVQAEPGLFNWPSHQIQQLSDGYLASEDYFMKFQKEGTQWDYLPLLHLKNKKLEMEIRLHFNGSYRVLVQTL